MFRLWDKQNAEWMPGQEGQDYNIEIYADGSFGVTVNKPIDGVGQRWVCEKSEYYELYMKIEPHP